MQNTAQTTSHRLSGYHVFLTKNIVLGFVRILIVRIWVFECCPNFSILVFITIQVFWVLLLIGCLSFVVIWVVTNWIFSFVKRFALSFVTRWVLSFSLFEFLSCVTVLVLSFVTTWVFEFSHKLGIVTIWVFEFS